VKGQGLAGHYLAEGRQIERTAVMKFLFKLSTRVPGGDAEVEITRAALAIARGEHER
jgi:hypothetical protein